MFDFHDLKDKMDKNRPATKSAKSTADKILRFPNESVDKKLTTEHCEKVLDTRSDINRSVDSKVATLEKQVSKARIFYSNVASIDKWAPSVEEVLEKEDFTVKEPEEMKVQLKKLDVSIF